MANVALSVTTDTTGAVKGIKLVGEGLEQVDEKAKTTSSILTGVWQGFGQAIGSKILNEALGTFSALSSAFTANATRLQQFGLELRNIRDLTEISTGRAQIYRRALEEMGKGQETLIVGSNTLKKNLHENSAETAHAIRSIGLSVETLKKSSPEKMFDDVVAALGRVPDPTSRAGAAMRLLGESGVTLAQLAPTLAETEQRLQQLGVALSSEEWAGIEGIRQGFEDLEDAQQGFWNRTVAAVSASQSLHVAFSEVSKVFGTLGSVVRDNEKDIRALVDQGLLALATVLSWLVNGGLAAAVVGFKLMGEVTIFLREQYRSLGLEIKAMAAIAANPLNTVGALRDMNAGLAGVKDDTRAAREELNRMTLAGAQGAIRVAGSFERLRESIKGAQGALYSGGGGRPGSSGGGGFLTAAQRKAEEDAEAKRVAEDSKNWKAIDAMGKGVGYYSSTLDIGPTADELADAAAKQAKADQDDLAIAPQLEARRKANVEQMWKQRDALKESALQTINWTSSLQSLSNMLTATGQAGGKLGGILGGAAGIGSLLQGFQSKDKEGNLIGGLGGGFKNIFSSFGKGASGILQGLTGVGGLVSAGLGIGKSLIGLFSGDPVKKAQKEIGKALGKGVSRDLAESLMNEAKATGKSLQQVAKEYEYQQSQVARQTMLEGLGVSQGGAEELMKWVPWARPEVALGAGRMFGAVFWKSWQEQGIEGLERMRPIWEDAVAKMTEAGLDPTALGMGSLGAIMAATDNERFRAAAGMSTGAQQILTGATSGNFVDAEMLEGSIAIAEEQLNASREAQLSDKDAYTGMAGLLQAQLNASIASGEKIPTDLQALLDEAKRNGISIIADPTIRTAVATEGIYRFLTGQGGSSQSSQAPSYDNGSTYDEATGEVTWGPRPSGYPGGAPWPPVQGGNYGTGGLIPATPGGLRVTGGEAGRDEYVLTGGQLAAVAGAGGGGLTVSVGGISVAVQSIGDMGRVLGEAIAKAIDTDPQARAAVQRAQRRQAA